jgi:hypothetical protein
MEPLKPFRLGVVEGFFGKSWSWEMRAQYANFLSGNGFTTYLYAPKNDDYFRKLWSQPCPQDHLDSLTRLSSHYRDTGIEFAIGLSPFELYRDFSPSGQDALAMKLEEINSINPDTFCILFDDMHGAIDNLADTQLQIMDFVTRHSKARHYIFCPTYYSDDPVLEQHFGSKPANYLEDLGNHLDSRIDIFWTGPRVFSPEFPEEHLQQVTETLMRKPLLWDNYPVNDSEKLTRHLHLSPKENLSAELKSLAQGHMANPMNQACLSQLALYSLGRLYNDDGADMGSLLEEACTVLCPAKLGRQLFQDASLFQEKGLDQLSDNDKAEIIQRYTPFQDHPMVVELLGWLQGDYAFDPECLT